MKVINTGDKIQYYDDSNVLRIEKTPYGKDWYHTDGVTVLRRDDWNGTIIYDTTGKRIAEFSARCCGVFANAGDYVEFITNNLHLFSNGTQKFYCDIAGSCIGTDGTHTYKLEPTSPNSSIRFQATDLCDDGGETATFLRSDGF